MRRLIFAGLVLVGALGVAQLTAPAANANVDCSLVRCPGCDPGYVFSPTPGNCCRCVKA